MSNKFQSIKATIIHTNYVKYQLLYWHSKLKKKVATKQVLL